MTENLAIPSPDFFKLLEQKGVEYLHHANTVETSLSFIEHKFLASRKHFTDGQITQTPQRRDEQDQLHELCQIFPFPFIQIKHPFNYSEDALTPSGLQQDIQQPHKNLILVGVLTSK